MIISTDILLIDAVKQLREIINNFSMLVWKNMAVEALEIFNWDE
ncbi:MAG: hypothetical protein ABIQ88_09830 [Chitinophagaceae bacterium]